GKISANLTLISEKLENWVEHENQIDLNLFKNNLLNYRNILYSFNEINKLKKIKKIAPKFKYIHTNIQHISKIWAKLIQSCNAFSKFENMDQEINKINALFEDIINILKCKFIISAWKINCQNILKMITTNISTLSNKTPEFHNEALFVDSIDYLKNIENLKSKAEQTMLEFNDIIFILNIVKLDDHDNILTIIQLQSNEIKNIILKFESEIEANYFILFKIINKNGEMLQKYDILDTDVQTKFHQIASNFRNLEIPISRFFYISLILGKIQFKLTELLVKYYDNFNNFFQEITEDMSLFITELSRRYKNRYWDFFDQYCQYAFPSSRSV
ncbi:LOW QUALITY PROTEIN: hypothetical protein HZS_7701, partial [Henneguya salminicola]